ncbi:phage-related protein [Sphingobium wenxiniae]|nr:type II toxin-antitoxin system RelE/ParE family toxin [Sphingobium wenxiniae]MBB6193956.1 phage-related protein [Sphingobium wenxiniae]
MNYCLCFDTSGPMKPVEWLGSSKADVRAFPEDARIDAGWQLELVQRGDDPDDWKPMKTVGQGVREIRIREASGAFRVIYLATLEDRVLVLHAFQKKTQATAKKDLELAAQRLKRWKAEQ